MGNWNGLSKLSMLCQIGLLDISVSISHWMLAVHRKVWPGARQFSVAELFLKGLWTYKTPRNWRSMFHLEGECGWHNSTWTHSTTKDLPRGQSSYDLVSLTYPPYQGYKTVENERLWVPCSITDTVNFCSHPHGQSICWDMSQQVSLMASVGNLNWEWLGKCFPVMGWL